MNKNELLKMDKLVATPNMMRLAKNDTPVVKIIPYSRTKYENYKYDLYIRCRIQNGILKVALFGTANMRLGGNLPIYAVYFSRKERNFITYDCQRKKWLTSKLDLLDWPQGEYVYNISAYVNRSTSTAIRNYLGTGDGRLIDLLNYQLKIREEQLEQRHKKETDKWDNDLAQTPPLPRDWNDG